MSPTEILYQARKSGVANPPPSPPPPQIKPPPPPSPPPMPTCLVRHLPQANVFDPVTKGIPCDKGNADANREPSGRCYACYRWWNFPYLTDFNTLGRAEDVGGSVVPGSFNGYVWNPDELEAHFVPSQPYTLDWPPIASHQDVYELDPECGTDGIQVASRHVRIGEYKMYNLNGLSQRKRERESPTGAPYPMCEDAAPCSAAFPITYSLSTVSTYTTRVQRAANKHCAVAHMRRAATSPVCPAMQSAKMTSTIT